MQWLTCVMIIGMLAVLWLDWRVTATKDIVQRYIASRAETRGTYRVTPAAGEKESWSGTAEYVDTRHGLWGLRGATDQNHEWNLMVRYQDGLQERRQTFPDGRWQPRKLKWFGESIEDAAKR